jgi:hypothetical protein
VLDNRRHRRTIGGMDTIRVIHDPPDRPHGRRRLLIVALAVVAGPLLSGTAGAVTGHGRAAQPAAAPAFTVIHHANGHDCLAGHGAAPHRAAGPRL